jgi:hypothetical protein
MKHQNGILLVEDETDKEETNTRNRKIRGKSDVTAKLIVTIPKLRIPWHNQHGQKTVTEPGKRKPKEGTGWKVNIDGTIHSPQEDGEWDTRRESQWDLNQNTINVYWFTRSTETQAPMNEEQIIKLSDIIARVSAPMHTLLESNPSVVINKQRKSIALRHMPGTSLRYYDKIAFQPQETKNEEHRERNGTLKNLADLREPIPDGVAPIALAQEARAQGCWDPEGSAAQLIAIRTLATYKLLETQRKYDVQTLASLCGSPTKQLLNATQEMEPLQICDACNTNCSTLWKIPPAPTESENTHIERTKLKSE